MDKETLLSSKKKELANHGRLHGEAWQCRLNKDLGGMRAKQKEALFALWKSRTYDYLLRK